MESPDDQLEVPIGHYLRRILKRWWIPALCALAGVAFALLNSSSGKTTSRAAALVFFGAPLTSNNVPIPASFQTSPNTPGILVKQEGIITAAAAKLGLKPGQLRGHLSAQPAGQPSRLNYTPTVNIVAEGPWEPKVAAAIANAAAVEIVAVANKGTQQKVDRLEAYVKDEKKSLEDTNARIGNFQRLFEALAKRTSGDRTQQSLESLFYSSQISGAAGLRNTQQTSLFDSQSSLDTARGNELASIKVDAVGIKNTVGGKSANLLVSLILGLLVGVFLALFSYAVVPERRTDQRG